MKRIPLPKVKRCCFCTRKLKVACILICFWSMLAYCHSISMLFYPACCTQYEEKDGPYHEHLTYLMWILFVLDMTSLSCSFIYFVGLLLEYKHTSDFYMLFGTVTAIAMFAHAVLTLLQMLSNKSNCTNPNDVLAHFIYFILWCYFILIINSHRDNMT